jgi:hypothetical protein
MTRLQLAANIIFFLPLLVLNLFAYGIQGDVDFIREVRKNLKKF